MRFTFLLAILLVMGEKALQFFWDFIGIRHEGIIYCEMAQKHSTFYDVLYNSCRFLLIEYFWTHLNLISRPITVLIGKMIKHAIVLTI